MQFIWKLKCKSDIFQSSNKSIFYNLNFVLYMSFIFHIFKMSKSLSAKDYQENEERLQKGLWKIWKSF